MKKELGKLLDSRHLYSVSFVHIFQVHRIEIFLSQAKFHVSLSWM